MRHILITLALLLLASCTGATPAPVGSPSPEQGEPIRTVTPTPHPTGTPTPTLTPQPTSTATPTNTLTPSPSVTHTPRPTNTATRVAHTPTPTPTPTATASSSRPVEPFDMGAFIDRLRQDHRRLQSTMTYIGYATRNTGECRVAFFDWDIYKNAPAYANVPEVWQPLTSEYVALMDQAVETMLPIIQVCQAGGGTIDDATDQQMLAFFDQAQNRVYELIQQAEAMR